MKGKPAPTLVDEAWARDTFIPTVQQRGAAIIKARGASSAASAASAAIDHVRDWVHGTPDGDWVSMAVPCRRQLRHRGGRRLLLPLRPARAATGRSWAASTIDDSTRQRMLASEAELREERAAIAGAAELTAR